jgi:hypothetical protein
MNVINVPWESQSNIWWNEVCAKIIEQFGLPGDRYTSHPTESNMKFIFKNEQDAFMCKILISEAL